MKDYADFDDGDLAQDEFFVRWVKEPTPELEAKWVAWLAEHPDKAEEVEEARRMILASRFVADAPTGFSIRSGCRKDPPCGKITS